MSQKLDELLVQQRELAAQMLAVLESESAAILGDDVAKLENINKQKQQCISGLTAMEAQWPAPLRADNALDWVARQNDAIKTSWEELVGVLRKCRRQNDANGLLIAQRQQVVSARLQGGGGQTYGSGGQQVTEGSGRWTASA